MDGRNYRIKRTIKWYNIEQQMELYNTEWMDGAIELMSYTMTGKKRVQDRWTELKNVECLWIYVDG